ncbi:MAG: sulfur oxidation c-type cytochrome SoxA, partial [Alphaproteobacteria bacterium]
MKKSLKRLMGLAAIVGAAGLAVPTTTSFADHQDNGDGWGKFEVEDRRSGYTYRKSETRALQDDEFENPGMIAYDDGEELWNEVDGSEGKSCASCHGDASDSMAGVGNTYPKVYEPIGKLHNLEQRINLCRTENMGADAWKYESPALLASTVYVKRQSLDLPMTPVVDGAAAPFF